MPWNHHGLSHVATIPGALLDHLPQHIVRESVGQAMLETDLCLASGLTTTIFHSRQEDPLL